MQNRSSSLSQTLSKPAVILAGVIASAFFCTARLFWLVNNKAVNLLYWDQFDFYTPLFQGQSWLDLFFWQHGIHRQGVGGPLTKIVADLSGWDGRVEAFFILALVVASLVLALYLKRRLTGKYSWLDLFIPLIVLNLYQYEIFIGTTNISPAGLSLFLVLLYAVMWTVRPRAVRYVAVLLVNFLAVFSGYSLFLGIVTAGLFTLEVYRSWRVQNRKELLANGLALLISLLTMGWFFVGYQFYTSAGCSEISLADVARYPIFMAVMQAKFIGLNYTETGKVALAAGGVLLAILSGIGLWSLVILVRQPAEKRIANQVVLALIAFTLLYSAGAAIGRSCLGMAQAQPSRYVTLLIPAFVGAWIGISNLPKIRLRYGLFALCGLMLLHSLWPYPAADEWVIGFYADGKNEWKACFLQEGNAKLCSERTNFEVHPNMDERIESRLAYLQTHRLNLFLDMPSE